MTTELESVTRFKAVCDAVNRQVRVDIECCPFRGRVKHEPERWLEWIKTQLLAFGLNAASKDCTRHTLRDYAAWVAAEYLHKADPGFPEFAISAILTGDDEANYWRAITIAAESPKR